MRILKIIAFPIVVFLAIALVSLMGTTRLTNPGLETRAVKNPDVSEGGSPASISNRGTIRIGVKFDHPGLEMKNLQGVPEGFSVDMGEYLAAKLGIPKKKITWVEVTSANREQLVNQGKVDIVTATLTMTDKRRKLVDFAGPYINISQDLIVPKGNPKSVKSPESPRGIKVCSTLGGAVSQATREHYPHAKLIEFDNSSKCLDAIKNGSVDAFATQGPIGAGYVSKDKEYIEMLGKPYGPEQWGIGLKKGSPELCEFLNKQLQNFYKDGSYTKAWNDSIGKYSSEPAKLPKLDKCR